MLDFVKIPANLICSILLLSVLSGCVSTYQIPRDMSFVAPSGIVNLKGKYNASLTSKTRGIDEINSSALTIQSEEKQVGSYILGPGDALTVVINHLPNSSYDIVIRPDGFISLPIVDEVKAAGLTPSQLDAKLTTYYSKRIVNPELSVMVRSARQPMVYVLGEVRNPSSIPFQNATSAAEAIARVGDMLPTAYENGVMIIRLGKDGLLRPIPLNMNVKNNNENGSYQVSPYIALAATQLEPEDILFIPEKGSSQLGTKLEQILKPIIVTGAAISSVLSPVLTYKLIRSIDNQDNLNISQ